MIYIDTSVLLAHLLGESRHPPAGIWSEELVSSRLLEYEAWNRVHAYGLAQSHGEAQQVVLDSIVLFEMSPVVLSRALKPFPEPVRTLDSLHLATLDFLRSDGRGARLFTYDERLEICARKMMLDLFVL